MLNGKRIPTQQKNIVGLT